MRPVLVLGGYGTFGSHVCRELVRSGVPVTVAGRDEGKAAAFANALSPKCRGLAVDLTQPAALRAALVGQGVVVHCAGPFQSFDAGVLEACLDVGCHYVDIADDRTYVALVRKYGERFRERGLAAIYGCSSLPGISGALALVARANTAEVVERVRVTLFIGNRNPKGEAAVRSMLGGLGQPIQAPQGTLQGFRDGEVVELPAPFGRRGVFNFDTPEYDLFPELLGTRSVTVKLGFELRLATYSFALLARLGLRHGSRTARLLSWPGKLLGGLGCSGAVVMTEFFLAHGEVRHAALLAREDGQHMAALPCALAALAMCEKEVAWRGAGTCYEFLGAEQLLTALTGAGFELQTGER